MSKIESDGEKKYKRLWEQAPYHSTIQRHETRKMRPFFNGIQESCTEGRPPSIPFKTTSHVLRHPSDAKMVKAGGIGGKFGSLLKAKGKYIEERH
jgi:hypothetical protein